ncbi:DUF6151 family protein [Sedimentitalea sp. JM2-8]|uniref:DUF6151 family protein n=1 Tax=Sedimentitalea xiamensis TaxID=3050037 RepID=A0ABT7FDF2_9RHOB|nr:DUF6151 family protein [Sedimentitalea xiamensis]MDK3073142.1 DUF6151 family protein [Sedimentitalea xiamensis]
MVDRNAIVFSCDCGQIRGTISPATSASGIHAICHCRDCRAAELHLNRKDPDPHGVELFMTTPDTVQFEQGAANLAILRLGPRGLLRWYANCCKVPMFNTLAKSGLPFSSIHTGRLQDVSAIGPVRVEAFIPQSGGAPKHKGSAFMAWRLAVGLGSARLSGRWKQTPFFDLDTGAPTAPVHVLTKEQRAALYT